MYQEKLLSFLRWKSPEIVPIWLPCRAISAEATGHVPFRNPVPKAVRRALDKIIYRELAALIREKKVIRYCHKNGRHPAGVRIHQSLVKSVLQRTNER